MWLQKYFPGALIILVKHWLFTMYVERLCEKRQIPLATPGQSRSVPIVLAVAPNLLFSQIGMQMSINALVLYQGDYGPNLDFSGDALREVSSYRILKSQAIARRLMI